MGGYSRCLVRLCIYFLNYVPCHPDAQGSAAVTPRLLLTSVINADKWSASRLCRFILGQQAPCTLCQKKGWAPKQRLTPWGDRKLSDPARNLTHFLGGASTLLTAIPTYPEHHSLNCSKIIWINIPYSDNIFYSFSLKSFRV